jgi:threonine dehydrogenase-like Zn-dependent dehydrogenase
MTEPVAVALQTIFDNMPQTDEKVLVIGGGVIGNLIIQAIRALVPGCSISLIEPSSFAPLLGMQIPMGGFKRIYDTVGIRSTLNLGMRLMCAMGTLSVVGIGGDARLDLTPLWLKLQTIKGVYAYGVVEFNGKKQHVFDIVLDLMQNGKIQADALVTHKFRLKEYERMIEVNLDKEANRAMKTVVMFND